MDKQGFYMMMIFQSNKAEEVNVDPAASINPFGGWTELSKTITSGDDDDVALDRLRKEIYQRKL